MPDIKLSIRDAAELMSLNFSDQEMHCSDDLEFKLRGVISVGREIAADGESVIKKKVSKNTKKANSTLREIDQVSAAVEKVRNLDEDSSLVDQADALLGAAGRLLTKLDNGNAKMIGTALETIATVAVGVEELGTKPVATITRPLKAISEKRMKNEIKHNATLYKDHFPDDDMLSLLSQLVSLSVAGEIYAIPLSLENRKKQVVGGYRKASNWLSSQWDSLVKKEMDESEESKEIKKIAKKEREKIWAIFDNFVRNPEEYKNFSETEWAKSIKNLFLDHCHLGSKNDATRFYNAYERNELWINVFARYLDEKDDSVKKEVLFDLRARFGALSGYINSEEIDKLQAEKEKLQGSLAQLRENRALLVKQKAILIERKGNLIEQTGGKDDSGEINRVSFELDKLVQKMDELKVQEDNILSKKQVVSNEIQEHFKKNNRKGFAELAEDRQQYLEQQARSSGVDFNVKDPTAKVKKAPYSPQFFVENQNGMLSTELFCSVDGQSYSLQNFL